MLHIRFRSASALRGYMVHPAHIELRERFITKLFDVPSITVVDFKDCPLSKKTRRIWRVGRYVACFVFGMYFTAWMIRY